MRHDEIAADLARKLEKATPGPWKNSGDAGVLAPADAVFPGYVADCAVGGWSPRVQEGNADFISSAFNAAPLLLSERAALREVEGRIRAWLAGEDVSVDCLFKALSALDAARVEA
ncbi:MAG TPA: hypothetical protein VFX78_11395 [Candidatus Eisenbacteria bacterium]|nr:hypothetical protein [Candidatus Eisenbacteria bacterium]